MSIADRALHLAGTLETTRQIIIPMLAAGQMEEVRNHFDGIFDGVERETILKLAEADTLEKKWIWIEEFLR